MFLASQLYLFIQIFRGAYNSKMIVLHKFVIFSWDEEEEEEEEEEEKRNKTWSDFKWGNHVIKM